MIEVPTNISELIEDPAAYLAYLDAQILTTEQKLAAHRSAAGAARQRASASQLHAGVLGIAQGQSVAENAANAAAATQHGIFAAPIARLSAGQLMIGPHFVDTACKDMEGWDYFWLIYGGEPVNPEEKVVAPAAAAATADETDILECLAPGRTAGLNFDALLSPTATATAPAPPLQLTLVRRVAGPTKGVMTVENGPAEAWVWDIKPYVPHVESGSTREFAGAEEALHAAAAVTATKQ